MPDSVWDAECDFCQSAAYGDPIYRESSHERRTNLMADEQNKVQSTNDRLHSAEVSRDPVLNTTAISLSSIDQSNSSHNILVSIAPEYGSNLFRFRYRWCMI